MKSAKSFKTKQGFSLIEILVVIAILIVLVALVMPNLHNSKNQSDNTRENGNARTINEAILRATLKGDENPVIVGSSADDINAAVAYLRSEGYIRE